MLAMIHGSEWKADYFRGQHVRPSQGNRCEACGEFVPGFEGIQFQHVRGKNRHFQGHPIVVCTHCAANLEVAFESTGETFAEFLHSTPREFSRDYKVPLLNESTVRVLRNGTVCVMTEGAWSEAGEEVMEDFPRLRSLIGA